MGCAPSSNAGVDAPAATRTADAAAPSSAPATASEPGRDSPEVVAVVNAFTSKYRAGARLGKGAFGVVSRVTRLADGDPQMSTEIALTNKERMQYWLDRCILELTRYRELLDEDEETIFNDFLDSNLQRFRFLEGDDLEDRPPVNELPDKGAALGGLFMSPKLYERMRDMMKKSDEVAEEARRRR